MLKKDILEGGKRGVVGEERVKERVGDVEEDQINIIGKY